jgi:bla regulator protein blaR1
MLLREMNFGCRLPEAGAAVVLWMAFVAGEPSVGAQVLRASGPLPSFEVVTIKPLQDVAAPGAVGMRADMVRLVMTAKMLIGYAYNMPSFSEARILGPGWMDANQFVVQAKIGESTYAAMQKMTPAQQEEQKQLMMQSLLAERLKLKVHFEKREMPAYALVVAKGGAKLTADDVGGGFSVVPQGQGFEMKAQGISSDDLASLLGRQPEVGGRVVFNQTGLTGGFKFTMRWRREQAGADAAGATSPDADEPYYFTAIQEQLGLRMMPTKAPVEFVVIEHIEMPSEN